IIPFAVSIALDQVTVINEREALTAQFMDRRPDSPFPHKKQILADAKGAIVIPTGATAAVYTNGRTYFVHDSPRLKSRPRISVSAQVKHGGRLVMRQDDKRRFGTYRMHRGLGEFLNGQKRSHTFDDGTTFVWKP